MENPTKHKILEKEFWLKMSDADNFCEAYINMRIVNEELSNALKVMTQCYIENVPGINTAEWYEKYSMAMKALSMPILMPSKTESILTGYWNAVDDMKEN